jgi:hypothetical protein
LHFTESFGGDFTGTLSTGVLVRDAIDEQGQIIQLEADYVLTAADGNHLFTVHLRATATVIQAKPNNQ